MTLSEVWIYPIKSLGGIRLKEAEVEERGLKYDRRWMVVDQAGLLVTQREVNQMALIDVSLAEGGLSISLRGNAEEQVFVPFEPISKQVLLVKVWDDEVEALTVSNEVDEWLSKHLTKEVRLVVMPLSTQRKVDPRYAKNDENVSFADGFPFLIISQASLDNLNTKLAAPLEMKRFRPNFVITGTVPHEEDEWSSIQIGDLHFQILKPCARCVLTTIDPETSKKGPEPLKTLATYRRVGNKILFGQNAVAKNFGILREGETVKASHN